MNAPNQVNPLNLVSAVEYAEKHPHAYLAVLMTLVLVAALVTTVVSGTPLIKGGESYYHLSQAKTLTWSTIQYLPLWLALLVLPENLIIFIPIVMAFLSVFLLVHLARKLTLAPRFTLLFLTLYIISPVFIWNYTTFSSFSAYLLLLLAGVILFLQPTKMLHYLSLLPLVTATFFDLLSTLMLIVVLLVCIWRYHPQKYSLVPFLLIPLSVALNIFWWQQPFILGPFQVQESLPGLVSDFGGIAGVSFFIILLAVIGLGMRWRNFWAPAVLLLALVPIYVYYQPASGFLAVLVILFATLGVLFLLERAWVLERLKEFTFLLLVLGLLFSTVSYLGRMGASSPTADDVAAVRWMKDNVPEDAIIFSAPDASYFVEYSAQRQPFSRLHQLGLQGYQNISQDQKAIMDSTYIDQLFPLLERNGIRYIYVNPALRERLPVDYGVLFLLTNERFKLRYSHQGYEIWSFE